MIKIKDHLFTAPASSKEVTQIECPKNTKLFEAGQPDTIVIHYTAGRSGKNSAQYLARKNVKASAHIVLDRSGHIFQLVPFNTISWHAGKSSYQGRFGFNNFSIGIEIDNAGILEPVGDKFKSWFGKKYDAEDVLIATHRNEAVEKYWHTYTEIQIEKTEQMCDLLMEAYPTITNILGHEEISPGRKQDPGPAFPLDKLRKMLIESREEDAQAYENMEGIVDVNQLNIRELPSINSDLASAPLERGTKLKIQSKHEGWYKVTAEIEGWVSSEYVAFN